jgi:hypothetical protein
MSGTVTLRPSALEFQNIKMVKLSKTMISLGRRIVAEFSYDLFTDSKSEEKSCRSSRQPTSSK